MKHRSATKTINIQTLNRGLYFIVLESGKDRWLGKYLKNKQNQKLNGLSTNYLVKMFGL